MAKRKIIKIDEEKCNGCSQCLPNCPEGAIQIIDGKARLISDLFCDGLGACMGYCPQGAISIEEREASGYDEAKVMENIVRQGDSVIKAHLQHLKEHNEEGYLKEAMAFLKARGISIQPDQAHIHGGGGCPGSKVMDFRGRAKEVCPAKSPRQAESQLRQWPVQIKLVSSAAGYFENADILIAADCVPFAYADFHEDLLKGKILLVGCPKLDDIRAYQEKLNQIFKNRDIKSVTYAHMEVPCCFGLLPVIESAIAASGKKIPFQEVTIGIRGERLQNVL
ncbi:MAG TPA: 4Fe-4S binding protein [Candidatus Margulisiibacteriota bacterium]|nr:4Fe-4S binding protein [Candidatus Margulisiibacteriota bacterium]